MTAVRRYEASMYDSNRWDGFELRPGDIIVSTPPKCGTTRTQMNCALLILQALPMFITIAVIRILASHL
jgi:aryl sulfotransferase